MSSRDTRVALLGDGGWGTTLALVVAGKKIPVTLWGAFPDYVEEMRRTRENVKFLRGFQIPPGVRLEHDIHAAVKSAAIVALAVPTQHLRGVLARLSPKELQDKTVVSVAKGIEAKSLKTPSQIVAERFPSVKTAVLSGPCIAREVAEKTPSAASVASRDPRAAKTAREIFSTPTFVLFESPDTIGVELGGAVKNVLAIGSGIVEGLGCGANTRALVFARGVAEMARLGRTMGARRETFMGLSGLGDLATTCLSPISRNRSLGEAIGKGGKLSTLLGKTEMVVEGVETAKAVYRLSKKRRVTMPISEAVYKVLFEGKKPSLVVAALLDTKYAKESD